MKCSNDKEKTKRIDTASFCIQHCKLYWTKSILYVNLLQWQETKRISEHAEWLRVDLLQTSGDSIVFFTRLM